MLVHSKCALGEIIVSQLVDQVFFSESWIGREINNTQKDIETETFMGEKRRIQYYGIL